MILALAGCISSFLCVFRRVFLFFDLFGDFPGDGNILFPGVTAGFCEDRSAKDEAVVSVSLDQLITNYAETGKLVRYHCAAEAARADRHSSMVLCNTVNQECLTSWYGARVGPSNLGPMTPVGTTQRKLALLGKLLLYHLTNQRMRPSVPDFAPRFVVSF